MPKRISLSEIAHQHIQTMLADGMLAVDATLGNGHDCLFLAQCVGETGHVYGFDIQTQAILASRARLQQHDMPERATLFQADHANISRLIPENLHSHITAIMFNLGYLPGADKTVITRSTSTLPALDAACGLLASQGIITVIAYPGHSGGDQETERVEQWLSRLDTRHFQQQTIYSQSEKSTAPRLFVIRKLS